MLLIVKIPLFLTILLLYGASGARKLDHLYVEQGGTVRRQTKGLPMGTNCSPVLANTLLFMYEYKFINAFVKKNDPMNNPDGYAPRFCLGNSNKEMMQYLSYVTRYIDDLWNPMIPKKLFQKIARHMYPKWLDVGEPEYEASKPSKTVNYLDMAIWHDGKRWQSKLYDKRIKLQEKGLKLNRFPHPDSKLSSRAKYGIITSQLHRFLTVNTKTKHFLKSAVNLFDTYIKKGYDKKIVARYHSKFLMKHKGKIYGLKHDAVETTYNKLLHKRQEKEEAAQEKERIAQAKELATKLTAQEEEKQALKDVRLMIEREREFSDWMSRASEICKTK